jgi:hypothetical protein
MVQVISQVQEQEIDHLLQKKTPEKNEGGGFWFLKYYTGKFMKKGWLGVFSET